MNPHAQKKLQAELDEALGPITIGEANATSSDPLDATHYEGAVAASDAVKALPYLDACINEGLRLHSTSSMGLPRIVPPGGLLIDGRMYPEGSILSVPSYTIHRDPTVWGEDAEAFKPERWLEGDKESKELMMRTFNPYSFGPRACVGKNLAAMELQMIIASIFRRFDFVLMDPEIPVCLRFTSLCLFCSFRGLLVCFQLGTLEGFLRKPLSCFVGVKPRDV